MSILARLKEYADLRMELPPSRYNKRFAAWFIDLTKDGEFENFICLKGSKKEEKKGKEFEAPDRKRSGKTIRPKLLFDTLEYSLGIGRPDVNGDEIAERHKQFKALVQECADKTQEPTIKAVASFLASWNLEKYKDFLPKDIDPNDVVTFRVGEIIPADSKAGLIKVQKFWASYLSQAVDNEAKDNSPKMQCLITGDIAPVAQRMPISVRGLSSVGGNSTGTELVSANKKPFTSYGLENSLSSPISLDSAERFAKALNHLLDDEQSRIQIGSTVFIWWTREKTSFNPLTLLGKPTPEAVKTLLESPMSSKKASSFDSTKAEQFYAIALTANNARAVVRDWLETTVPNVQASIQSWFRHQELVDPYGDKPRPFGTYVLAASLYRDAAKEMQAAVPTALMRGAILGERLPEDLLVKIVRRNRVEREITYPRAVLLKLILSRHPSYQDSMINMEQLNPDPNLQGSDRIAYACGRLLAVLESTQRLAVGSVNAALTDRYYGAASSTPAIAFPPLLKLSRAHFSKLRKTKPGPCKAIEERFEEITCQISTFPKTFNLQQQGLFGLGYYHQKASERAQFRK